MYNNLVIITCLLLLLLATLHNQQQRIIDYSNKVTRSCDNKTKEVLSIYVSTDRVYAYIINRYGSLLTEFRNQGLQQNGT